MRKYCRHIIFSAAVLLLGGCSLLKVSLPTGDSLSAEDARMRAMTRGLYYDLSGEITSAADSISASADVPTRIRAVRWKIRSTRSLVTAAMQGMPDVAMADTWIICRHMERAFIAAPDTLLFGAMSDFARNIVRGMSVRCDSVARNTLSAQRYELMREYVEKYIATNPVAETSAEDTPTVNTTLAWIEFMKSKGIELSYKSGSIAEVVADMGDRVSSQTGQAVNSIGWSKDIVEMQLQRDSLSRRVQQQLDSLDRSFERIVVVMENMPQVSDAIMASLTQQVETILQTMDESLNNAFGQIDRQRAELQAYVSSERTAVIDQTHGVLTDMTAEIMNRLPAVIRSTAVWIVLLVVILLGLPFAAGFWVGTLRERLRRKAKDQTLDR